MTENPTPSVLSEAEREAMEGLAQALSCSQCGRPFSERPCGIGHAMVASDPRQHRLIAPLLAAHVTAAEDRMREVDGLRVEIVEKLNEPTRCEVWRHGVLIFAGSNAALAPTTHDATTGS